MDWRIVAATFGLIFVAELGDKTQLMVFARTAATKAPVAVFIGAAAALAASSLLGVIAGGLISKVEGLDRWIKLAAGLLFIALGGWTLWEVAFPKGATS